MENALASLDVALSLFQGLNTELSPADVPEGQSPDTQDCVYLPGDVSSRPCTKKLFGVPFATEPTVLYGKTYTQENGDPLNLYLDSLGVLRQEDVNASPGQYATVAQVAPGVYCKSASAFGREYMAFSDGLHGSEIPRQYNGSEFDRVSQDGVGAGPSAVADSVTAGSISAGVHQMCVLFLTRQGYITAPSPPMAWTAAGNFKVAITGLPIGPANVIARIIAFTSAGGGSFFYIPADLTIPTAVSSTVVLDNTSTTATLDFTDNALLSATAIDIPGNNLFELVVLGPCLGVFAYAGRLFWWGELNMLQIFVNMGFEGGIIVADNPLGWTVVGAGGALVNGTFGLGWRCTGTAAPNTIRGLITQEAYQDAYGAAILEPGTQYSFRPWLKAPATGQQGQVIAKISSVSSGFSSTATIDIADATTIGGFLEAQFSLPTPSVIPTDMILSLYAFNQANNESVIIDEVEMIYTDDPYLDNQFRVSYINNPESFDGLTGILGPASDPHAIREPFVIRDNMYLLTSERLHETADNGTGEPSTWTVREIADKVGALSFRSVATGEDWASWASNTGQRFFNGGTPYKVSQEIQPTWDAINREVEHAVWVVNDPTTRRLYVGVPLDSAVTPSDILVLDYKELETALAVPGEANTRKWSLWNLEANCGAILSRGGNFTEFCIGAGNGQALGVGTGFGNVYSFDEDKLTDDDYGAMEPYYTTHFFSDPKNVVGSHRKLGVYLTFYATGVGKMRITPLIGRLGNAGSPTPAIPLQLNQDADLEIGMNVLGERIALKFQPEPLEDTTDVKFSLSNLVFSMRADPWSPVRGAN